MSSSEEWNSWKSATHKNVPLKILRLIAQQDYEFLEPDTPVDLLDWSSEGWVKVRLQSGPRQGQKVFVSRWFVRYE